MIDPHKVAETLLIYGELSLDQYEEIIHPTLTRHKSCVALLNCIKNASDIAQTYSVLVKALEDDSYPIDFLKERSSNRKGIDSLKNTDKHIKHTAGTEDKRTSSGCFEIVHENKNSGKEQSIVDAIEQFDVKLTINDRLLIETKCSLLEAKKGSIVFELKMSKSVFHQLLTKQNLLKLATSITQIVFTHHEVSALIPNMTFSVKVQSAQSEETDDERNPDHAKTIYLNKEFLVEEIDVWIFINSLLENGMISSDEKTIICTNSKSRRERTRAMLDILLKKDIGGIDLFLDDLKSKKPYVYAVITGGQNEDMTKIGKSIADNLEDYYNELKRNISPSVFLQSCRHLLTLSKSDLQTQNRTRLAQLILQDIIKYASAKNRELFVRIMVYYGQIPETVLEEARQHDVKRIVAKALASTDFHVDRNFPSKLGSFRMRTGTGVFRKQCQFNGSFWTSLFGQRRGNMPN
ncbi:hypothetical protein MAR_006103 [Mya arenaria]|uniref:CARD domain-containing protein n=1 Tax=Mya arenaria TaxID=6604 RepID=A0ABY7DA09_MYAAR|nr:hypothetical protein MAR_006103 [Mya arenaria]